MATKEKKFYVALGQGVTNAELKEKKHVLELNGGCLRAPLKQKISDGKFIGLKQLSKLGNSFEIAYAIAATA